jgi:hypothetical protein
MSDILPLINWAVKENILPALRQREAATICRVLLFRLWLMAYLLLELRSLLHGPRVDLIGTEVGRLNLLM